MLKAKGLSFVFMLLILIFSALNMGCGLLHRQVKPDKETVLNEETFPKLLIPYSVAIRDESQVKNTKCELCGPHYVEANDMINFAIEILKDIFRNNKINVVDKGEKQLILTNIDAKCTRLFSGFKIDIELKVTVGDSLKKQFYGTETVQGFATTWAVERSIGKALRSMLEDTDVIQYLQKK